MPKRFLADLLNGLLFWRRRPKRLWEGWTFEKIEPLSTEQLLAGLARCGVTISVEQFAQDARRHDSAQGLNDEWERTYPIRGTDTHDRSIVWMATAVLWKRLVPDHISFEQISDEIQNGYDLLEQRETGAACDAWWRAWQWVKGKVNAPRDPLAALSRPLPRLQDIYNWCLDFEMELGNAGVDDPAYYRLCIRYCQEFLAAFPYLGWDMRGNFLRAEAEAHWNLGEIEVAEQKFVALIAQNPDWAWGYIGWSDQFWFFPSSPKNYRRAEEILQQALARPNLEDRNDVLERLSHLRKEKPLLPAPASSTPTKKTSAPAPSRGRDKHKRKKKSRKH